jgi:hypothetical protein
MFVKDEHFSLFKSRPSGATYSANFRYRHKALPENIQQGQKSCRGQTLWLIRGLPEWSPLQRVGSWLTLKNFSETNTLAYFPSTVINECKKVVPLPPERHLQFTNQSSEKKKWSLDWSLVLKSISPTNMRNTQRHQNKVNGAEFIVLLHQHFC